MKENYSFNAIPMGVSDRAVKLLKAGWAALELSGMRNISQNELSGIVGVSPATIINWTSGATKPAQVEAVLQMLERLPAATREDLMWRFLRAYPTVEAKAFSHLPAIVSRLRGLLRHRAGLTIIQGGTDSSRTFVFTALGHSFLQTAPRPSSIAGLDVHSPDWFVPVQGIKYIEGEVSKRRLRQEAARLWPRPDHASWLMLNGAWSFAPERHRETLGWVKTHHVVLADDMRWAVPQIEKLAADSNTPVSLIEIEETNPQSIRIDFRPL